MLWIGGPPGAGKTTVAIRLARRHGLRWYGADTRTWAHRDRALREGNERAARWESLSPEARWALPAADLLELSLHRERGPMVLDDLAALPAAPLVVAEGSTLPADRAPSDAVWLLPTPELQRERLEERGVAGGRRTLYLLLAETIEREARDAGVRTIAVDGSHDVDATVAALEELFADALAAGPRAETTAERRALLREANEAIVEQVRAFYARPWADGDADARVQSFLCECGDPRCTREIEARVRDAAAAPLLAHAWM